MEYGPPVSLACFLLYDWTIEAERCKLHKPENRDNINWGKNPLKQFKVFGMNDKQSRLGASYKMFGRERGEGEKIEQVRIRGRILKLRIYCI